MLLTLCLRDFVIVERLELEFASGFTALTGETGAGKSILIDALSLALGERGETGLVRQGCDKAEISAEFAIADLPELQRWLADNELAGDGPVCLMRRVIHADGRSRGFINGYAATMQQLREAGDFLVDIYSQHAHHSLLKPATQRALLDDYAGASELAGDVASAWQRWRQLFEQRSEMERNAAAWQQELAELRDEVRELAQLNPSAEEWEALQQEHHRLSHMASLLADGQACRELLSEGELAVTRQLNSAQHALRAMRDIDAALQEVLDGLDSARIQIEEADHTLKKYLDRAELDPERLQEAEARIQALHAAARKYRVRPEELAALWQQRAARLQELADVSDDGALARREAEARDAYLQRARALSARREAAGSRLGEAVSREMQRLALSGGRFEVALLAQPEGSASGLEQVEFRVAGHAGVAPRALARVASGGELSRISLALRVITARQAATPTMIFDEVDVGIGGGVAEVVGQLLKALGASRQVLVITHLPQVAAQGQQHLRVSKHTVDGATVSRIDVLDAGQRVHEIARMLGGVDITDTTRRHAAEMLGVAPT